MLYLFLYFVCCKLPHGKFTNSKTSTATKYNTSETKGFTRKAEQTLIVLFFLRLFISAKIHSFFIKKSSLPARKKERKRFFQGRVEFFGAELPHKI